MKKKNIYKYLIDRVSNIYNAIIYQKIIVVI